jgi:hypothetical protein
MTMQHEAIFESPATHEASHYSNPYSNPEMEYEWEEEMHETSHYSNPYSNPEMEYEWETHESTHYSNPESDRFLGGLMQAASSLLGEEEVPGNSTEWEADPFIGKAFRRLKRGIGGIVKTALPVARMLAPLASKAISSLMPVAGKMLGGMNPMSMLGQMGGQMSPQALMGMLSKMAESAEQEVAEMENEFFTAFSNPEGVPETGQHEITHEAALTEMMAAEAVAAESEAEAEAVLAAALPITITIMGARRPLRRVVPVMTQANGRLVRALHRQGPAGQQLLRTVPGIQRRAVAILRTAARQGQPITAPLAVQAMSTAAGRVLNNSRLVRRALRRNAALRVRVSPYNPRRAVVYAPNATPLRTSGQPAGRRPSATRQRAVY